MLYSEISFKIGFCIFLLGTHFQNTDGISINNVNRYQRQSITCGDEFLQCGSGECISEENLCDGRVDCRDESDEKDDCRTKIVCIAEAVFQCNYGGCIDKTKICNGNQDCRDNSDETLPECANITQTSAVNDCGTTKFRCDSGQCIDDGGLCDGIANCFDRSDESTKSCSLFNCPPSTYRCNYGACVHSKARCNNVLDCYDASDEAFCPGTSTEPTPTNNVTLSPLNGCPLPQNPSHGKYFVGQGTEYKSGDLVPRFSFVTLNCSRGYKAFPQPAGPSYCINQPDLYPLLPQKCVQTCPSINPPKSTIVKCSLNGIPLSTCLDPVENTLAHISCEELYEEPSLQFNPSRICKAGSWDYSVNPCTPICGAKRSKGVANIANGTAVTKGDYPWQVAVYRSNKQFICGGSLINQKIVLSAAHCFADYDGNAYPKENYLIAGGKYYYNYDDQRDTNAQYSEVEQIHVPEKYKSIIRFYSSDIAVIILSTPFRLTQNVGLVCIDMQSENDLPYFETDGTVTGWGFISENNERAEELRELSIPYVPFDKCFSQVPTDFRRFITDDKICGGYLDQGLAVCKGDSGSGLVFPKRDGLYDRYYVRGIVSTSPGMEQTTCSPNEYGTYTSVAKHSSYIRDLVTSYRQI